MTQLGYKKPLAMGMIGHKRPLGKSMIGHRMPMADLMKVAEMTRELEQRKKANGLERARRGNGSNLGQYA